MTFTGFMQRPSKETCTQTFFNSPVLRLARIYFLQRPPSSHAVLNLMCRDRQYHDKFRRIFAPGFTNTALTKFEPNMLRHLDKIIGVIHTVSSQGLVDMTLYCKYFVMDVHEPLSRSIEFQISAELALGEQFNTIERDKYRPLIKDMEKIVSLATYVHFVVWLR